MWKLLLSPLLVLMLAQAVWADIYKHVDAHGNITFTNTPIKGAQRILIEPSQPAATTTIRKKFESAPSQPNVATPSSFPRVDSRTQKDRDINRRNILEDELANEQRLLIERQKELAHADTTRNEDEKRNPQKYLMKLGRLREALQLHEKNISALQSELSKLR